MAVGAYRLTSCMSARRFLAACSLLTRLVWPASHVKEAAAALDSVGGEPLSDPRSPLQGGAAPSADDTACDSRAPPAREPGL